MSTIDQVIDALVNIGKAYPKTQSSWASVFAPRTHQTIAQELINLQELSAQNRVNQVKTVVYSIYQRIEKPSQLLREIDKCLRDGEDFQSYAAKCSEIQKTIDESDNKAMKAENCDLQITFNIKNYRDAIESINPKNLHQSQVTHNVSIDSPSRASSIFSNAELANTTNRIPFEGHEL